jgi:DNA-binding transcriptional regulator GbsR (MarR family)
VDRVAGLFVDGIGAAAASSKVLSQLQGRIFALLYLQPRPLSLEEIAAELQQSKSNISVNIRGLVEWHLVRRTPVPGSRKDHYEAATDFFRVMQAIMEHRFRWNLRQVLATITETERAADRGGRGGKGTERERTFVAARLAALRAFAGAVDTGIGAFSEGKAFDAETVQNVIPLLAPRAGQRS